MGNEASIQYDPPGISYASLAVTDYIPIIGSANRYLYDVNRGAYWSAAANLSWFTIELFSVGTLSEYAYANRLSRISATATRGGGSVFNSADDLIKAAGKLTRGKSGNIGSVKGNADDIFKSLTQGATKLESGAYKLSDGTIINLHKSITTQLPTISINQGGIITKIRIIQ